MVTTREDPCVVRCWGFYRLASGGWSVSKAMAIHWFNGDVRRSP